MAAQLKENLLKLGFTADELARAELDAQSRSISFMHAVELLGKVDVLKTLEVFSAEYRMTPTNLADKDIPASIISLIPRDVAIKYRVVPIERAANNILLAAGAPIDLNSQQAIAFRTKSFIKVLLASETHITDAINKHYSAKNVNLDSLAIDPRSAGQDSEHEVRHDIAEEDDEDGPAKQLINYLLQQCMSKGASDIHIEPFEKNVRVRLRIDGDLVELIQVPLTLKSSLVTRVKILSKMVITETRKPQDGNIRILISGKPVDFRVNSVPTTYGEKIVLRILDRSALQVDMKKLGFDPEDLVKFTEAIHAPFGMVLVTGPTGSGKTTTLYSAMTELNKIDTNIMTAEDPVEYTLDGINQVHVRSEIGMSFADALRAFLRQDPDVIMVGEIRDLETAEIAVKAALTGHLLLSTLHTNSAAETISRLLNMGVEPFNVVASLTCIVAQRLVRRICPKCKTVDESVTPSAMISMGVPAEYATRLKAYKGGGCQQCRGTGMRGRVGVHEVLVMNDRIKRAILDRKSALDIKRIAMECGMKSLRQSALLKMSQGLISADEVMAATVADTEEDDMASAV